MSFDENPQSNGKIDLKKYKENIPKCCKLQTYEEHRDILMFCWGLIHLIKRNAPDKSIGCKFCTFYKKD